MDWDNFTPERRKKFEEMAKKAAELLPHIQQIEEMRQEILAEKWLLQSKDRYDLIDKLESKEIYPEEMIDAVTEALEVVGWKQ